MGYDNRDKTERKSGRAGFMDARLEELRRRWENATDERERLRCPNKSASGNLLGQNSPRHPAVDNRSSCSEFSWTKARVVEDILQNFLRFRPLQNMKFPIATNARAITVAVI